MMVMGPVAEGPLVVKRPCWTGPTKRMGACQGPWRDQRAPGGFTPGQYEVRVGSWLKTGPGRFDGVAGTQGRGPGQEDLGQPLNHWQPE